MRKEKGNDFLEKYIRFVLGKKEENDLVFKIIDNGSGFDDETYKELKLRMQQHRPLLLQALIKCYFLIP